jgi:hypothetical protein
VDAEIERGDVRAIMLALLDVHWKLDRILVILGDDGEEEEEADA